LPELPSNILCVEAEGCHSLEDVSLRGCTSPAIALHLFNCPKLIQNRGHQEINLAVMLLKQSPSGLSLISLFRAHNKKEGFMILNLLLVTYHSPSLQGFPLVAYHSSSSPNQEKL
jgi:hypothetical protein